MSQYVLKCFYICLSCSHAITSNIRTKLYSSPTQWGYTTHKPGHQSVRPSVHSSLLINIDVSALCPIFWRIKAGHTDIHICTYVATFCSLVQMFWTYTVHDKLDSSKVKEISLSTLLCLHQLEQEQYTSVRCLSQKLAPTIKR